jgi:hypothetical protein
MRERGSADGLTRRDAERALRKLIEVEGAARPIAAGERRKTVDDAVNALRDKLALEGARLSYEQNCESMQRIHISPSLGDRRLDGLSRDDIERLALTMRRRGRAPKTIANVLKFLTLPYMPTDVGG